MHEREPSAAGTRDASGVRMSSQPVKVPAIERRARTARASVASAATRKPGARTTPSTTSTATRTTTSVSSRPRTTTLP